MSASIIANDKVTITMLQLFLLSLPSVSAVKCSTLEFHFLNFVAQKRSLIGSKLKPYISYKLGYRNAKLLLRSDELLDSLDFSKRLFQLLIKLQVPLLR